MTNNNATATRRERRIASRRHTAGKTGRTAGVALAASGLVLTSGVVAANATESSEGREFTTIQVNTSDLNVERASNSRPTSVSTARDAELTFDRPAVSSEAAPQPRETQVTTEPAVEQQTQQGTGEAQQQQTQQGTQQESSQQQSQQSQESTQQQESSQQQSQQSTQQESSQQQSQQSQESTQQESSQQQSQAASSQQSEASTGSASGSAIVQAAYRGIGSPYSWGGNTPAGFDCSGFVNWAYAQAGQPLSARSTGQMLASMPRVSSPQVGDIIISNNSGHAEIYIGNGQVISATSSGVRVHAYNGGWNRVNAILRPGG